MKDFREFLNTLEQKYPEEVVRVKEPIDPEFEISTVLWKLEDIGLYPMAIFDNVKNLYKKPSGIKVVSNVFARRGRIAHALGLPREDWKMELSLEYYRRRSNQIKPKVVDKKEAPVKEVIQTGDKVDLWQLPVVTHHEMDSGAFFTLSVVAKDPDNGVYNVSFQRMWVKSPKETGISIAPRHLWDYYVRYEKKNQPMPIAVVLGHHPSFYLGSMASVPIDTDEYDVIGGLFGEPLRLTPSETWGDDFLVPADAEIVVEGIVPPRIRKVEAPFGEFTGYYGGQRLNPIVQPTAVTRRGDAIYQTIFLGHPDIDYLQGVAMEGDVYAAVKPYVPSIKAVYIPSSGKSYNCYISIKKRFEGAGKLAAMAAIPTHDFIKHVIVVDDDLDIYKEEEVLFAFATRVQGDEDIEMIKGIRGNILDPSATRSPVWTNVMIDATKPINRPFEERVSLPKDVYDRLNLNDFVSQETVKRLKEKS